jgi:hypothetical protein
MGRLPVKTEFHQIPSIDGIPIPLNSMEFSMEFYGIPSTSVL